MTNGNEKLLTLEEIAKIVETITEWDHIYDTYYGKNESYSVMAWEMNFFWSKNIGISVDSIEPYIELGSVSGKEVFPLYQRVQELWSMYYEKKEQERTQKRNGKLREIRGKIK